MLISGDTSSAKELPHYFPSPNKNMMDQIKIMLKELPIVPEKKAFGNYYECGFKKEDISRGDGNQVVEILEPRLWQDYRENIAEFDMVLWTIDYVLDSLSYESSDLPNLWVATRMISPDANKGNILYGVSVFRISDEEFLFPLR